MATIAEVKAQLESLFSTVKVWQKEGKVRLYVSQDYKYNGIHPKTMELGYVDVSGDKVDSYINIPKGNNELYNGLRDALSKFSLMGATIGREAIDSPSEAPTKRLSTEELRAKYPNQVDRYGNIKSKSDAANDAIHGEGGW